MTDAAQWKVERVKELKEAIMSHPVVGVVDIHGIPGKQFSKMRRVLRGQVDLYVSKITLISLALDEAAKERPGLDALKGSIEGQVGLVVTQENPFSLYKLMEATKTPSPAKGGELAPDDIVIKAGDTKFKPGPVVREFTKVGIPAAIEQGKVVIKRDAVLVKAGEPIPKDLAAVLPRLDILPLELGLDLRAAYEEGTIYRPDVLEVDMDVLVGRVRSAAAAALNLAVNARIFNEASIRALLAQGKAFAFNLAIETGIITEETAGPILARAYAKAMALASHVPDALDDELRATLGAAAAASPEAAPEGPEEEAPKKDEPKGKKEEKVSEEDAAAGLGALFG